MLTVHLLTCFHSIAYDENLWHRAQSGDIRNEMSRNASLPKCVTESQKASLSSLIPGPCGSMYFLRRCSPYLIGYTSPCVATDVDPPCSDQCRTMKRGGVHDAIPVGLIIDSCHVCLPVGPWDLASSPLIVGISMRSHGSKAGQGIAHHCVVFLCQSYATSNISHTIVRKYKGT